MILFFKPSLIQKEVLEGAYGAGGAFNENKSSEFLKIKLRPQVNKKPRASIVFRNARNGLNPTS